MFLLNKITDHLGDNVTSFQAYLLAHDELLLKRGLFHQFQVSGQPYGELLQLSDQLPLLLRWLSSDYPGVDQLERIYQTASGEFCRQRSQVPVQIQQKLSW